MVGAKGLCGCITELMPAAKKGTPPEACKQAALLSAVYIELAGDHLGSCMPAAVFPLCLQNTLRSVHAWQQRQQAAQAEGPTPFVAGLLLWLFPLAALYASGGMVPYTTETPTPAFSHTLPPCSHMLMLSSPPHTPLCKWTGMPAQTRLGLALAIAMKSC